ncbi:MAG TPA: lipoprotein signal peptidase [Saprospiraceae bacterium]|nr:lipoprotein signal peptidase [Saprospiraceae bacterium]
MSIAKKSWIVAIVVFSILVIDQVLKIYIKTNFEYGGGFDIMGWSWAKIHFVENEGMAFGMTFGGSTGKLILSLFRLVMISVLIFLIYRIIRAGAKLSLILSFAMILTGALGNMIDSAFYGLIFSETPMYHGGIATMFPEGGGYAPFLYGKVVDMFYFPMIDTVLPEWIPLMGGERFRFFNPVFNIADSMITIGTLSLLLFHRRFFTEESKKKEQESVSDVQTPSQEDQQNEEKL